MSDAELAKRLDMLRAKGVVTFALDPDGKLRGGTFGPLPGEAPAKTATPPEKEEPLHPADLVANPPAIGAAVEEDA